MIVKASFVQYARGALCSIVLSLKSDSASDGPVQPTEGKLKTLSQDGQRALWAQAFINCIKEKPPLFKELREESLHERLLNMKQPFQQQTSKYLFSSEIQTEMKRYFMPKVGYSLPADIYTQVRFEKASRGYQKQFNQIFITFYPTYSTTGHMFQKILQKRRYLLLYGRWGIGKSLSALLCSLLFNHVNYYISKEFRTNQFKQIKSLLSRGSVLYWSMISDEKDDTFLKKMIYQNRKLWSKYKIKEETFLDFPNFINDMKQRDPTEYQKFQEEVFQKEQNRLLVIDQINVLASNKREHQQIFKNQSYLSKSDKQKVINNGYQMNKFKDKFRETGHYILYNSSSNIQTRLIARKNSEQRYKLKLGDGHADIQIQSFKYEERLSFDDQNIAFLELSQFFTHIIQQFGNFSNEVEEQWKNEDLKSNEKCSAKKRFFWRIQQQFRKMDWNIAPNAVLIVKQIKGNSNILSDPKSSNELEKEIIIILNKLLIQAQEKFQEKIINFVEKQLYDNSGDVVKTQKFYINLEIKKQIILRVAEIVSETTEYVKKSFFQIKIKKRKNFQEFIDKEIFTIVSNNYTDIVVRAFMDPKYFLDSVNDIIFTDFNPNLIEVFLPGQIYDTVKKTAEGKIGRFFEKAIVKLMKSLSFNLYCPSINKYYKKYEKITINNFVKDQKEHSSISLQEKFSEVKQQMRKKSENLFVCIPKQFQKSKKKQTNWAFDFAFLQYKDIGEETQKQFVYLYHFFDTTVSLNSQYIEDKIANFVQMISSLKQIKSQPNSTPPELKNKISFYVLGLLGESKKLTKEQLQHILRNRKDLFDFSQGLEITFYELKYEENILQKRTSDLILSYQIIDELKKVNAIYTFYKKKQAEKSAKNKK